MEQTVNNIENYNCVINSFVLSVIIEKCWPSLKGMAGGGQETMIQFVVA